MTIKLHLKNARRTTMVMPSCPPPTNHSSSLVFQTKEPPLPGNLPFCNGLLIFPCRHQGQKPGPWHNEETLSVVRKGLKYFNIPQVDCLDLKKHIQSTPSHWAPPFLSNPSSLSFFPQCYFVCVCVRIFVRGCVHTCISSKFKDFFFSKNLIFLNMQILSKKQQRC